VLSYTRHRKILKLILVQTVVGICLSDLVTKIYYYSYLTDKTESVQRLLIEIYNVLEMNLIYETVCMFSV